MKPIILVVFALFHVVVHSVPADPPSYGTIAATDFSNNLAMINQNLYNGVTALSNPLFRFAIDTAPNLAQLYAIFNGVNIPPVLVALAKDLYGKAAVGAGKLVGDAAVLGSTVLESSMNVGSHGLQAGNNVLEAAGKSGINLAGKLGDYVASGTTTGTNILASGLKVLGDGLQVGSVGVNVVSQGIAGVLDAIGKRLVDAIASAEKTAAQLLDSRVKILETGALKFADEAQARVYNALTAYLQILSHVQNLVTKLASIIDGVGSAASVVSASGLNVTVAAN